MLNWPAYPFLRITIAFIAGIVISETINIHFTKTQYLLFSILGFYILGFTQILYPKKLNILKGIGLLIVFMSLAGFRLQSYSKIETIQNSKKLFQTAESFTAIIVSYPSQNNTYYTYLANTRQLISSDSIYNSHSQKIKIYVSKEDSIPPYQYGDLIHISGNPFEIPHSKNPYTFDYAHYMGLSNIYFQAFTSPLKSSILAQHKYNNLMEAIFKLRLYFETIICKSIVEPKAQSIALALLLGIKDQLDPETKKAYSTAGAMHVLAVSGLHIGIIHFIIIWIFKPIKHRVFKKRIQPIISILLLWGYAMLTGFSPSILRAATMFSIIIYGNSLNRHPSIYNSIALSALLLLIIKPTHLFSVGFQLSYLAVLGIVYIHPKLQNLHSPTSWIGNKIWSIICVSMAAQISTAPISILYFHQFPSYFLISNLIVIPAAFIIMTLGILLLITNQLTIFAWVKWVLSMVLNTTNWVVEFIQNLPHSLIDWINISPLETLFIYLLILYLLAFEYSKKIIWIKWTLFCCTLFTLSKLSMIYIQSQKHQVIFYNTYKSSLIDHISGLNVDLYTLNSIEDPNQFSRQINPMRLHSYLLPITSPSTFDERQYLLDSSLCFKIFDDQKFLFVLNDLKWGNIKFKIDTDYLVIENNATQSMASINNHFDYKTLILSNTNDYNTIAKLKNQARKLDINPIAIREGALIINTRD